MVTTKMFHTMIGKEGGTEGVDHDIAERSMENIGAWIMGRNMFGPVRGPWPDNKWRGWWGERPPYHVPVFVLTHYAREPLTMEGGTTFHFITGGIDAALEAAKKAAQVILRGSSLLEDTPRLGRPMADGTERRELFIPFGSGFYVLRYFLANDIVVIVRVWHGREDRKAD